MTAIWCYTVCYGRRAHLAETLPGNLANLDPAVGDRWLVGNVGLDAAVSELCKTVGAVEIPIMLARECYPEQPAPDVDVAIIDRWDVGAVRNLLLARIPPDVVAWNVDADNHVSAENVAECRRWFSRYGDLVVLVGPGMRGPHGRVAGIAGTVRGGGGWPEGEPPGSVHEVCGLVARARVVGRLVKEWRTRSRWISHAPVSREPSPS